MTGSALYVGSVLHRRLRPRLHRLRYRAFWLLLDLDEIDLLDARLRLFSRNRFNLVSFFDRDHGNRGEAPLREQVTEHLRKSGIVGGIGAIRLLTMPRIFGFAFNPLSVYFCHARSGALAAILYEVSNTFGERHTYVLPVEAGDLVASLPVVSQHCAKRFHVSPFLPMDLAYAFRIRPPGETAKVAIHVSDASGPVLVAVQSARRRAIGDLALARACLAQPLMTLKVVAGIVWEAARLWAKRIPLHPRPAPPAQPATYALPAPCAAARNAKAA